MLQVRDGDVGKLAVLFERHHVKLFNFLVRLTDRRDASEDLVQDVFFRVLKYRHTFRGDAPFTAWMYQMETPMEGQAETHQSPEPSPADVIEVVERRSLLRLALSRLPAEKREVLVLSRYQGLKYEEIGLILNCPVGTVKARVHHALKELRDIYLNLSEEAVL